jgi:hypothetical protein
MTRWTDEEVNDCQECGGTGFVDCPDHGAILDDDGWCAFCEAPMDGGPAHQVLCDCQDD